MRPCWEYQSFHNVQRKRLEKYGKQHISTDHQPVTLESRRAYSSRISRVPSLEPSSLQYPLHEPSPAFVDPDFFSGLTVTISYCVPRRGGANSGVMPVLYRFYVTIRVRVWLKQGTITPTKVQFIRLCLGHLY